MFGLKLLIYISFYYCFLNKVVFPNRPGFLNCFSYFYCRLIVANCFYGFGTMICFSLSCCDVFFVYGRFKRQNIFDHMETTNQIIVINILQNYSYKYSSLNSFIKCIGFELIYYAINLSFIFESFVFYEFDYIFLSNVLLF